MRLVLHALTEELRRLRSAGLRTVAVSEESLAALRRAVQARAQAVESRTAPVAVAAARPDAAERSIVPKRDATPAPPAFRATEAGPTHEPPPLPAPPQVTLPAGTKQMRWEALMSLVQADPTCRSNVRPGKKVVLGVGSLDAKVMFVGEAPGAEEEIQGEPFVGPAGQLLTKMIQGMGLKRGEVYIGNIMNWRPQLPTAPGSEQMGNRPPTEAEMRYCLPYLRAQVDIVAPELLVALGKTAVEGLLGFGKFKTLGEARGLWHDFAGKPLMVTYHPSYILREPTNRKKRLIWEDLLKVMERAALPISDRQRGYFLER